MQAFFAHQMDFIYFVYGLSFILLAMVSYFVSRAKPQQKFWILISCFGFLHGISEWMDMVAISFGGDLALQVIKLVFGIMSYLCFAEILRQKIRENGAKRCGAWVYLPLLMCVTGWGYVLGGIAGIGVLSRYILGLCGGLATAWIIYHSLPVSGHGQRLLKYFAAFLAAYIFTYLFSPASHIFPSMVLNQDTFYAATGFPVQILRMAMAMVMVTIAWAYYAHVRAQALQEQPKSFWFGKNYMLPLGLGAVLLTGWVCTDIVGRQQESRMKEQLLTGTDLIAARIPVYLVPKEDILGMPDIFYMHLKEEVAQIMHYYPNAKDLHLICLKDGRPSLLMDIDADVRRSLEQEALRGDSYKRHEAGVLEVFRTGRRFVSESEDGDGGRRISVGILLRALSPGVSPLVLGVDFDAKAWPGDVARYRLIPIMVTAVFILLLIGFFVAFKREHESKRDLEEHQKRLLKLSTQLEKERVRLEAIFNSTQVGFLWLDEKLHVRRVNSVLMESFGYGVGALQVGKVGELCALGGLLDIAFQVIASGKNIHGLEQEFAILVPNGSYSLWFDIGVSVLHTEEGRGILFSLVDITDRKHAEHEIEQYRAGLEDTVRRRTQDLEKAKAKAEEASRLKSQFLFNVSHEIRTPLNGIVGFSELIARSQDLDRVHSMAKTVLNEADILLALVNDVLDQGKLEEGKLAVFYAPVDLKQLMADVIKTVTIKANEKGVELRLEIGPDVPVFLLADRLRMCQVLLNLLNNAVKFTDEGSVVLKAQQVDRVDDDVRIRFSVVDTGMGIPEEKQHLIFERFAQVDGAATRKHGGAGLGTSIAKNLVELMGGTLGFVSQLGVGTTFWCEVPFMTCSAEDLGVTEMDEEKNDAAPLPPKVAGPILVVEDYEINRDVVRAHLDNGGYQSEFAADGFVAVKACELKEYKLILMDIQMPGMDGYETTRRIRALGGWVARVPILGVTANADDGTRASCLAVGMHDILTKPIRRKPFLLTLAHWMNPDRVDAPVQAPVAAANVDTQVFDYSQAVAEFGDDKSLVDAVLDKFFTQVEEELPVFIEAIAHKDGKAIGAHAHKIKGGASNLTAMKLASVARMMEEKGKANDLVDMEGLFEQLKHELDKLKCAVDVARK